ncbi:MAG: metal-dependent hydrolase [Mariprofundales bacterium]
MTGKSHKIIGAASGFAVASILNSSLENIFIIIVMSIMGSLLPDIDHAGSIISRKLSWLNKLISPLLSHRGLTHSGLAIAGCLWLLYSYDSIVFLGICTGYISHIFMDMLTVNGVKLFYPFSISINLAKIRTGSAVETTMVSIFFISLLCFPYLEQITNIVKLYIP